MRFAVTFQYASGTRLTSQPMSAHSAAQLVDEYLKASDEIFKYITDFTITPVH